MTYSKIMTDLKKEYTTISDAIALVQSFTNEYDLVFSELGRIMTPENIKETGVEPYVDFVLHHAVKIIQQKIQKRKTDDAVKRIMNAEGASTHKYYFITVGFPDLTENLVKTVFNGVVPKITEIKGFNNVYFVCEKYRQDGIHYHIHFLVDCELPKSKVIQFVYQKVKKWVGSPNFVDVKTPKDSPYDPWFEYVHGRKRKEKLECVEKDRQWRQSLGIISMDKDIA